MRISDWSSDVCSSDLSSPRKRGPISRPSRQRNRQELGPRFRGGDDENKDTSSCQKFSFPTKWIPRPPRSFVHAASRSTRDRKSVVEGKSGSVRGDLGGRRIIKKKNTGVRRIDS